MVVAPGLRTHRPTANPRGEDDGTNPLLQRDGTAAGNNRRDPELPARRGLLARHGEFLHNLVEAVGPNGGHHTINVNIDPRFHGGFAPVMALEGRHGRALLDIDPSRPWREQLGLPGGLPRITDILPSHRSRELRTSPSSDEAQAVEFRPIATTVRWQEEARMLFSGKHQEKATRILNSLLRLLVPAAMEAKKQRDKAEKERRAAEAKAREEEEKRKAAEDARLQKEKEERDAKEAEEAAERARLAEENTGADGQTADETEATSMEGVVQSEAAESSTNAQQEEAATDAPPAERVTMTIRGREFDITHLGIDLEFLQELPEELREEVVMTQVAEQRAQAQAQATQTGEQGTGISREFLDALPPDIQRELLRQEEVDRRRAQQEEARHRAAEEGNAPAAQAEEMNNADLFAMLEPNLRRTILMDSDENQIAALPEHLQAEARSLHPPNFHRRAEPFLHQRRPGEQPRSAIDRALDRAEHAREGSRQRRPVIQMLDKAGIATLLRLMFVSLPQKAKNNLHSILADVCKNTQNRAEVISILLSILQDGTADVAAVERSFAALSLRAKQQSAPKTPQLLKRTATGTVVTPSAELSPLNIVHACLGTLNALTTENPRVSQFFLTEHDSVVSSKIRSAKKGKGKEVRAAKFPLNALLGLLDRKLITENTGVMETLASLLNRVTAPLHTLARRAKEAEEAEKARAEAAAKPTTEATTEVTTEATAETPAPAGADVQMEEAANAEVPSTTTAAAAETTAADAPTSTNEGASTEDQANEASKQEEPKNEDKKAREPVPPEVPEENIRLVVNIMTARECPSKTFVDTLDVIRNLSGIPGAKEIFGKELARQAQGLSESVLADLEDLAKQMDSAQTETDLQGLALANFSSATAKPTKLLRVIVAIDYLFNPRSNDTSGLEPKLKEDILAVLYESSTFDKLWSKLSQCLTAIRVRGNMINVATILLPLIESLMVVCRNTSLNEPVADPTSPQITVSSPAPESRLESLFFSFTEEHRKILNELIRNNPKLMNNNFDVLAKNSKVLEFDNKRSYFNRKVHTRVDRTPHPSLQLSVRRDHVFLDSFKSLYYKNGNEIKYGKLNIRFHGEEGIDAGGVSREWFAAMARQMFNPDYALFNPVASDRTTFHPNPLSEINDEHLMFFKFIGRIIGKALYEGRVLDCHFSRAVYRRILGKSVSLKDMESLDLDYYKSLVWILENDITDITFETFSVDIDRFGVVETVDLIPDGQNIPVTEENKHEYVRLVVEHRLIKSIEKQLTEFLKGFHEIIPSELISIFNEQELELLISGLPEIDVDDWKNNTEYQNYQPTSPQIQWFWRAVRSFDKEEKAKLLQFVTGTSKVPLNGFKELEGMNGFARFNIHRDYSNKEKLPSSHTCFNQLDLPEYESYEHLRQQLYTAITAGSEYFGFA